MAEQVMIPLPDGRWLSLNRETFEAALSAGAEVMAAGPTCASTSAAVEPLLDPDRAAERLGVSARWLEDSARAGIIPHHRLGKFVRFRVSEIADHCRVKGAPIPGTERFATDSQSFAPKLRLARQ